MKSRILVRDDGYYEVEGEYKALTVITSREVIKNYQGNGVPWVIDMKMALQRAKDNGQLPDEFDGWIQIGNDLVNTELGVTQTMYWAKRGYFRWVNRESR